MNLFIYLPYITQKFIFGLEFFFQILNQPLAPQTLVLLNQLLQQIKTLQQLISQQTLATTHSINGKPNNAFMQCSVLITKTKQTIANLQVCTHI